MIGIHRDVALKNVEATSKILSGVSTMPATSLEMLTSREPISSPSLMTVGAMKRIAVAVEKYDFEG